MRGQYKRNTEILKNFFKKPSTLVISILFFVSAIIACIYIILNMIPSEAFVSFSLCAYSLLAILPAAAFLKLFIQGRKAEDINRLNTPVILVYMYTVLSILLPAAFFVYFMFFGSAETNAFEFMLLGYFIIFFIIPASVLFLLLFISTIITFHSIRKSANGIYLSGKGSVFMGVTSYVAAAAVSVAASCTNITSSPNLSNLSFALATIEAAVLFALFLCLGSWALMYSSVIKKAAVRLRTANPAAHSKTLSAAYVDESNIQPHLITDIKSADVFNLPLQQETNPYESTGTAHRQSQEEAPNRSEIQNPYENFVPRNPFEE